MIDFFRNIYSKYWVPILGRILNYFVPLIEGKKPKDNPTYKLRDYN